MPAVGSQIASQEVAIYSVIVMVFSLHVDEFIVALPTGIGFGLRKRAENEAASFSLTQFAQKMLGVLGEQQIADENPQRLRPQRDRGNISSLRIIREEPKTDENPIFDGMTIDTEGRLWVARWFGSCVQCKILKKHI